MIYTGGECSVLVPRAACVSGEVDCSLGVAVGNGALVSVPSEFCHVRAPSSAGLAARLSQTIAPPPSAAGGDVRSETLAEWWSAVHPRWSGGHDVSGHVFLLTLSAVLLFGEIYPTLAQLHRTGYDIRQAGLRTYVALGGAVLVALWVFILSRSPSNRHRIPCPLVLTVVAPLPAPRPPTAQTSIWFHTVLEKVTGLLVAGVGIVLAQYAASFV